MTEQQYLGKGRQDMQVSGTVDRVSYRRNKAGNLMASIDVATASAFASFRTSSRASTVVTM